MDRRSFLKTTTAAAAASTAAVGAGQAVAAPPVVTARVELQVAAAPHIADAARRLSRDIGSATGGRIVINVAEATVTVDLIAAERCDGAVGQISEICAAPELSLFSGLPGALAVTPENLLAWYEAAGGTLFLEEAAAHYDLAAFIAGHSGANTGLWASGEIDGLRSFAAAEVSTPGLGRMIADRIGDAFDTPTNPATRIALIEQALPPLEAFLAMAPENREIWYRDGLHAQGFATVIVLSRAIWDKLGPSDQLLIATLARTAAHTDLARVRVADRLEAPAIMRSLPTRSARLSGDIVQAIQYAAVDVVHDAMSRSRPISQAFEAYGAFYEAMIGAPLPGPAKTSARVV